LKRPASIGVSLHSPKFGSADKLKALSIETLTQNSKVAQRLKSVLKSVRVLLEEARNSSAACHPGVLNHFLVVKALQRKPD